MSKVKAIALSDCELEEAEAGDLEQQICIAQAHLSNKNCEQAQLWAEKVWIQDDDNEYDTISALELLSILDSSGECIEGSKGFWKSAEAVLGDIIPEDFG